MNQPTIVSGKEVSDKIKDEIALEVENIKTRGGKVPHLAAVLVGDDGASVTYVNGKVKACERVGFNSTLVKLDTSITEDELLAEVEKLNQKFFDSIKYASRDINKGYR